MKFDLYPRFYLWLTRHRPLVFTLLGLITIAGIFVSSRLDLEEDILDMLPRNDQRVDEFRYALGKFRQIDRVYLDVAGSPAAADRVYECLATNKTFGQVTYRVEMNGQQKVVEFLTGALPNLFTAEDERALADKLAPGNVREYLTGMRRRLTGPEGMVLKDVVAADPVGMSALVVAKVLPLQTGFGESHVTDGRITSGDGRHVLLLAEPVFHSSDSRASGALVKELLRVRDEVEREFPGSHVAITGGHRMAVDNASIIRKDATLCISIGLAAMLVLCWVAYRRRWLAPLSFLPSLFGTLMAGVVLAFWQKHLSAIATGFASIAVGITVDYAIHVIYHLDDAGGSDQRKIGEHLGRLVFPITIGVITTLAAFLVMTKSPMHGYQQLGILGTIGVIFSAAFALLGGQEVVEKWVLSLGLTPLQFMILAQFIIFILGWPLEWTEIIVIFMPIFIPLLDNFGVDPLFFGLLVALNLQTAFLSPPVAMAAFYLKGVSPPYVTLNQIFSGMLPFMGIQIIAIVMLYLLPEIGLWLPQTLYGR